MVAFRGPSPDISPSRLSNKQMSFFFNHVRWFFENPAGYKRRWPRPRWSFARVRAHTRYTIRHGYASAREHAHAGKILRDHRGP